MLDSLSLNTYIDLGYTHTHTHTTELKYLLSTVTRNLVQLLHVAILIHSLHLAYKVLRPVMIHSDRWWNGRINLGLSPQHTD